MDPTHSNKEVPAMSADELHEYCLSASSYELRVQIRFKNGLAIKIGKIRDVQKDGFQLVGDDNVTQQLRYAWIARIRNA